MHGITIIRDEVYTPYIGTDPTPEPPLGDPRYNTTGQYLGTQDDNSRMAGTWLCAFTAVNAKPDYADLKTDAGVIVAFVRPDGFIRCEGRSSGAGDGVVVATPWDGWLWRIRPNVYFYALYNPGDPGYACALYPVLLNRSGDLAIAAMMCDEGCGNPPSQFWEYNTFVKVSDTIDESIWDQLTAVTDQWLL